NNFYFSPGWALKQNQKFGIKSEIQIVKRVIQLIQGYFHLGNANHYDRYTAERMLSKLQALAISGKELYSIMLPKIQIIRN
ncbi:5566_t:CDS:1, partial [Funneliformis caledonium]